MLRDKETARAALKELESAHKLLMDSLSLVKTNCSREEYEAYRVGMSQILGRLFYLVMEPIYRQHPSLAPADTPEDFLTEWTRPPAKPESEGEGT